MSETAVTTGLRLMTVRARFGWIFTAICMSIAWSGCGSPYDASVAGVVTLDGRPVPRGTVVYYPAASGPAASARISDDGSYVVQTGKEAGLAPGEYQVTIIANEPSAQQDEGKGPPPLGKAIVPLWYRSKATSGLAFQVEPGSNEINLELSSKRPSPAARTR
jgi:hypothetical protein